MANDYDTPTQHLRELFRDDAVVATSLDDFLDRFYKPDRYRGRGEAYAAVIRAGAKNDLCEYGFTWMSRYESVTGRVVAYYPAAAELEKYRNEFGT